MIGAGMDQCRSAVGLSNFSVSVTFKVIGTFPSDANTHAGRSGSTLILHPLTVDVRRPIGTSCPTPIPPLYFYAGASAAENWPVVLEELKLATDAGIDCMD